MLALFFHLISSLMKLIDLQTKENQTSSRTLMRIGILQVHSEELQMLLPSQASVLLKPEKQRTGARAPQHLPKVDLLAFSRAREAAQISSQLDIRPMILERTPTPCQ